MAPGTSLRRLLRPSICSSCRQTMRKASRAPLSTSARLADDGKTTPPSLSSTSTAKPEATTSEAKDEDPEMFKDLYKMMTDMKTTSQPRSTRSTQQTTGLMGRINASSMISERRPGQEYTRGPAVETPHHLHVYAHKHNTHMVLTRPNREPILSYSAGNIGFRKAQRSTFDAAFQLAAYVMRTIADKGLLRSTAFSETLGAGVGGRKLEAPIRNLEVVFRGFGKGREGFTKALLGNEGRMLRAKIMKISDDTKLKFGGTRSPNPRRLG